MLKLAKLVKYLALLILFLVIPFLICIRLHTENKGRSQGRSLRRADPSRSSLSQYRQHALTKTGSQIIGRSSGLSSKKQCADVLHNMLTGRWHQLEMTHEEVEELRKFHKKVRERGYHLPPGDQRTDMKCGRMKSGPWFRGLCDPDGKTPCCFNNTCVDKPKDQCTCPNCFDMRTPVQAEYAIWRPEDSACEPKNRSVEEICGVLKNSNLVFIGDSLVRQVYTALLLAIRGNDFYKIYKEHVSEDVKKLCAGLYLFPLKQCRPVVDRSVTACQGTVQLQYYSYDSVKYRDVILRTVLRYGNRTRTLVFLGAGIHDGLDKPQMVTDDILQPLLREMKSWRLVWPRLLWSSMQKFGIMKFTDRDWPAIFNHEVNKFLVSWGVPVFNTYNLTDNVMSFDGVHYGLGVNRMKARILLHYIQQLKEQGKW